MIVFFLIALQIYPANPRLDRYEVVPTLGRIGALTVSAFDLFALSDQELIVINKSDLRITRTVAFDAPVSLMAYDQFRDELWLAAGNSLIRFNLALGSIREYPLSSGPISALAVTPERVYFMAGEPYSLQVMTGVIKKTMPPEGLNWSQTLTDEELQKHPYLSPYYYRDDPSESQVPMTRFEITALLDDGLYVYAGTDRFGVLRYNALTLQHERVIYGPLDSQVRQARRVGGRIAFLTEAGLSFYDPQSNRWSYRRLEVPIAQFLALDTTILIASNSQLSTLSGTMVFPITEFPTRVLALGADERRYFIGTEWGMFQIPRGTRESFVFGPDKNPVRSILVLDNHTYVGTDFALYRGDSAGTTWDTIMPFGVQKMLPVGSDLYCLSVSNQLIRCRPVADSQWILLPYFNIYDIETDSAVVYCAGYNGLNYYDPAGGFYKPIYRLPRLAYRHVFLADGHLLVVADGGFYRLAVGDRD